MSTTPNAVALSRALGWFSIGLGIAELLGARNLARTMGMREARPLIRGFGLREIGTGLAILGAPAGPAGLWARVAGDVLDLAALGRAASDRWNPRRDNALLGFLTVAGVTLVDVTVAMMLHERSARASATARRTKIDPLQRTRANPSMTVAAPAAEKAAVASG
jgi:hypothetical protein